jgi:glycosyltransferase involved in cell wall biosynthesis
MTASGHLAKAARLWRKAPLPHAVRKGISPAIGWAQLMLLRRRGVESPPPLVGVPEGPLILSGFHHEVLGLGSAARATAQAMQTAGLSPTLHDIGFIRTTAPYESVPFPSAEPGGVWIAHCNPPELERLLWAFRGGALKDRYRIGIWAWELEALPKGWIRMAAALNEIWAPSHFVADAITRSFRTAEMSPIPVQVIPHPLPRMTDLRGDRKRFGLAPDQFVVLTMFDVKSTTSRKNPLAAIRAFIAAFSPSDRAILVCKVVSVNGDVAALQALHAVASGRPDIVFMTEELSDKAVLSLIASADVVLSLHRSEGFGLVLAEAMRLRKCVVATGWSGNMDFMDDDCAVIIPYTLEPVGSGQAHYKAGRWAEPNVKIAGEKLRQLYQDHALRTALGTAAFERITRHEKSFYSKLEKAAWRSKISHP